MGKVIHFPAARRAPRMGSGVRVFEAVYEEDRVRALMHLAAVQALSVAAALTMALQLWSLRV